VQLGLMDLDYVFSLIAVFLCCFGVTINEWITLYSLLKIQQETKCERKPTDNTTMENTTG